MFKKDTVIQTIYNERAVVKNRNDLINAILELNTGFSLSWWELEGECELGVAYTVEKMEWSDSIVVLIGGFGGDVLGKSLNYGYEVYDIEALVDDFFNIRFIKPDELIAIACN